MIRVHRESGDAKALRAYLSRLFKVMDKGGKFAMHTIPQFNGLLFRDTDVHEQIGGQEIHTLERLNDLNWAGVEPAVFGTLFEGILEHDPKARKAIGAHYTSRDDIELIVEPVLMEPLRAEWREIMTQIEEYAAKRVSAQAKRERARRLILPFHKKLTATRVLDPACGSGNFLYVSLALLKALEKQVIAYASTSPHEIALAPRVHPQQLRGIEINAYAHELATIVVWIGYLQWKKENQPAAAPDIPILQPLDQIELKDAIVDRAKAGRPREATWPEADVIVGNPPFLGGKMLRKGLGDEYVAQMFAVYEGRVERQSDLCCYWFEKAREAIEAGSAARAGLLATQAIRGGANRRVLERIKETGDIFYAQSDRPWVLEGASVRVAMVGFDDGSESRRRLNEEKDGDARGALLRARPVAEINANLTSQSDVTQARRLQENVGISFQGPVVIGAFDIDEATARRMLAAPNPHGKPNSEVISHLLNASDITRRSTGRSIIDFGQRSLKEAALFEAPFEHVRRAVKPLRERNRRKRRRDYWWQHGETVPGLKQAVAGLSRFAATPRVARHRVFVWVPSGTLPDTRIYVFARSDDFFFGVLSSRAHEAWSLANASRHGVGNDPTYNNTTCFETFPLPHGSQAQHWAISLAARRLNELRENWLNPQGMVGAKELNKRTSRTSITSAPRGYSMRTKLSTKQYSPRMDGLSRPTRSRTRRSSPAF